MCNDIEIVYQDEDIVVVDKPSGIVTHEATSFHGDDVYHLLVNRGVAINTSGDSNRQGIVSRLDVGTSGLLVVAKNESSYQHLKHQFSQHRVVKQYLALAHNHFKVTHGTISAPIDRHRTHRALFAVVEGGKPAVTHFDVIRNYTLQKSKLTLLEIQLETGRTHQIRVHMSAYGHPLVGDQLYGGKLVSNDALDRPFLHSALLEFQHPATNALVAFKSEISQDLQHYLANCSPD